MSQSLLQPMEFRRGRGMEFTKLSGLPAILRRPQKPLTELPIHPKSHMRQLRVFGDPTMVPRALQPHSAIPLDLLLVVTNLEAQGEEMDRHQTSPAALLVVAELQI
jgi:hypothetical protein